MCKWVDKSIIYLDIKNISVGKPKTMTNKSILSMVVSSSGTLQNSLLALMTTIPRIRAVLVAEDINSALRMVENHQIALILLDVSSNKLLSIIHEIKIKWPQTKLIVLVEDLAQQIETEASEADSVLIKGFSAQKFVALIEDLLSQRENEG